ncbi:hypothetical protein D3C85_1431620 [compost metagenome]
MESCAAVLLSSAPSAVISKEHVEMMVLRRGEPTEVFEWFRVDRAMDNVRNDFPRPARTDKQAIDQ